MTCPRVQPFNLVPHPSSVAPLPSAIDGELVRTEDGQLKMSFILRGAVERIRLPSIARAQFADELWRRTCCEAFIAAPGSQGYYEFNFSPSTEWAAYRFLRTRERAPLTADLAALDPQVRVSHTRKAMVLEALVRLDVLGMAFPTLKLGISAVIECADGSLTYWALKHPAPQPDFHHPEAFALALDNFRH